MRIENSANRNNANAFQKKKHSSKEETKENATNQYDSDHLDLSTGIVLLTRLLEAPAHQYKPLPFYFSDAATKNAQQIAKISKSIQQKARLQDVDLKYEMISDLVISHNTETARDKTSSTNNNQSQNSPYKHISLQKNESLFFEHFHNEAIKQKLTPAIVSLVVMAYWQHKQRDNLTISSSDEQTNLLLNIINRSDDPTFISNKNALSDILLTLAKTF